MPPRAFATKVGHLALSGAVLLAAAPASADDYLPLPSASGAKLTLRDGRLFLLRACDSKEVVLGTCKEEMVLELPKDVPTAVVRSVPVGPGTSPLFHVLYTDAQRTWEALVAPRPSNPVLFSGYTSFGPGAVGDRTAPAVEIREGNPATVLVGERSERGSLCGQGGTALLRPKMFVAKTGEFAAVSMHRLSESARARATSLAATLDAPGEARNYAKVLDWGLASDGSGESLLDGVATTSWSETKKGDGHGEFASLRVTASAPLEHLVLTLPGRDRDRDLRSPKSVYIATDQGLFHVVFPKAAESKAGTFTVAFPTPQTTTCLAISLDESFGTKTDTAAVSISDVYVRTSLDTRSARDLSSDLDGDRGESTASYLERVDKARLQAVLSTYESLGPAGRARALAIGVGRAGCIDQGAFLVDRLVDADKQVRERARAKLERCGKGATEPLLAALSGHAGAEAAGILALVAPSRAVLPLQAALAQAEASSRPALRSALARSLRSASTEDVTQLLTTSAGSGAEIDVLRAASSRLPEVFDVSANAVLRLLGPSSSVPWESRYVLAAPLLELVRRAPPGSAVTVAFETLVVRDASEPVRAKATELASSVPSLRPAIERALADKSPRVRREAALALAKVGAPAAAAPLLEDPWPFVRSEALLTLRGVQAPSPALVDSVAKSLHDDSPGVRAAAIAALGKYKAVAHHKALVSVLYDDDEASDVRVLAARALGEMCSHDDTDRLTKLARASTSPVQSQLERDVAFAAIEALGDLHPKDLEKRLAPLLAMGPKAQARAAAERALAAKGACP